jgi:DNA invertase Pin-like site-specific DNA recombinase
MKAQRLTALIYARYSPRPERKYRDPERAKRDARMRVEYEKKNSCDVQIADLKALCLAAGYRIDEKLIFRDDAKSGKALKQRSDLKRLRKYVRSRKSGRGLIVVCRDAKRLARNMLDSFMLVRWFVRRGCLFETRRAGRFDETDPMRLAYFGFESIMAEVERLNTAKETKRKMRSHMADGRRMSGIVQFGFTADPDDESRVIPVEHEQAVLARIYRLSAEGRGRREIARMLNSEGVGNRGHKWNHVAIGRIMRRSASGGIFDAGSV